MNERNQPAGLQYTTESHQPLPPQADHPARAWAMGRHTVAIVAADSASMTPLPPNPCLGGSQDGTGAGDYDTPYTFGRRPRANAPSPFSLRQYTRLLVLRSRVQASLAGADDGTAT
jgi:hypothetical protein